MTRFEITYIRTGSGEKRATDYVVIYSTDERKDGSIVNNIIGAIEFFEELAEGWRTYENKNSIVKIEVEEI